MVLFFRHGTNEKVFRLEFISNQEFTESEFTKWKEICHMNRISLPTLAELENKVRDIKAALAYQFKEEDVEQVFNLIILVHKMLEIILNKNIFRLFERKSVSKQILIIMQ